jgi:hypothetical protein
VCEDSGIMHMCLLTLTVGTCVLTLTVGTCVCDDTGSRQIVLTLAVGTRHMCVLTRTVGTCECDDIGGRYTYICDDNDSRRMRMC